MDSAGSKVNAAGARLGEDGQVRLASGVAVGLRMWRSEKPGAPKAASTRAYETVGFVLEGRAELDIDGSKMLLEPGDSWTVPRGASHSYRILETFSALEATAPPAP